MTLSSRRVFVGGFALIATLAGVSLGLLAWSELQPTIELAALIFAVAVVSALPLQTTTAARWSTMPPSFVIDFMALLLLGPHVATVVAGVGAVAQWIVDPERAHRALRLAINAVTAVAAIQAAGGLYWLISRAIDIAEWPQQALPIALAVAGYCVVKSASAEIITPLAMRQPINREWPATLQDGAPSYFLGASVATAIVALVDNRAWELAPVVLVPLYFAYRSYSSHVALIDNDQAHIGAVESLAQQELALKRSEDRLKLVSQGANDGLWEWDLKTKEFYCSGRWRAMLGLEGAGGVAAISEWFERVHPDDRPELKAALEAHLSGKAEALEHAHRIRHHDGTYRRYMSRSVAARGADRHVRIAGSLTEIVERMLAPEPAQSAGTLDPLTGLGNRAVFVELLEWRLEEFKQGRTNGPFAALYLDLDRFKVVNDNLGHLVGDELLTGVSRRLESCLRPGDALARLGGDEFAILLSELGDPNQANAIAFRIQHALTTSFAIGGREVFTSASIGIACGPAQYTNAEEILRDADTAMYHAKSRGKARHELFDADMHARERDRVGLENDLRHAVNTSNFELHYQPIVLLNSGMCVGFESLARWSRNGEQVSPAVFIPLAEELGIIEPLGNWALEKACTTFADWKRRFPASGLDYITVNVSSRQLMQQNFVRIVERAVHDAGLKPCDLRLEITETALMDSPNEAAKLLAELREFGAKIYLDDFGCGYSSLSHLAKLPVDALKIDRSFVKNLTMPDRPAIVESILALARTLRTGVVAEGIEQEQQGRELERLGCTHAQGYLFSRAVSATVAEEIIAANQPLGPKSAPAADLVSASAKRTDFDYSSAAFEWPDEVFTRKGA